MGCEFKPRHFACMAEYKKGNECTIQKIQSDQPRLQNRRYAGECWEGALASVPVTVARVVSLNGRLYIADHVDRCDCANSVAIG